MTAPTAEPTILQILLALCTALMEITQDNGFYNDVAGAGVEPLSFNAQDSFPQITVREDSNKVTDSNGRGNVARDAVISVHGFVPIDAATAYTTAYRFRDDIERVLRSVTQVTMADALGKPIVNTWSVLDESAIEPSELAEGFLEVVCGVSCSYRDFSPPFPGI